MSMSMSKSISMSKSMSMSKSISMSKSRSRSKSRRRVLRVLDGVVRRMKRVKRYAALYHIVGCISL